MITTSAALAPPHGRTLTANATLAYVIAAIVNSLLHESAHAVAALALGLTPTISPFSAEVAEQPTDSQQIIVAAAGPVFSLVMGLVLMVVARRWGRGVVRLFWMWLPFMGVMNFVGYCFIAPFAQAGDTGQVLALLKVPGPVFFVVAAVGIGGQFLLARRFAVEVKRYATDKSAERLLAYFPWLIGTPILIVLTLVELLLLEVPVAELVLVAAYSVAFGIFAPMQFIFSDKVRNTFEALTLRRVNVSAIAVAGLVSVLDVTLAGIGGVRLG
jgi:hypothetical protein